MSRILFVLLDISLIIEIFSLGVKNRERNTIDLERISKLLPRGFVVGAVIKTRESHDKSVTARSGR